MNRLGFYQREVNETEDQLRRWIFAIAQGDKEAFAAFYSAFVGRLAAYLQKRLSDPSHIHDLLQEIFIAVWKNAKQYSGKSKVSVWVYGIARNKMMDALRTKYKSREEQVRKSDWHSEEQLELVERDFAEQLVLDMTLQQVMEYLPADLKEMMTLVFEQGFSYREVAEILEIPVGTVKSRMYHLKGLLKKRLIENGVLQGNE